MGRLVSILRGLRVWLCAILQCIRIVENKRTTCRIRRRVLTSQATSQTLSTLYVIRAIRSSPYRDGRTAAESCEKDCVMKRFTCYPKDRMVMQFGNDDTSHLQNLWPGTPDTLTKRRYSTPLKPSGQSHTSICDLHLEQQAV